MSDVAIRVENLGKQYRIGGQKVRYRTIRETLVDVAQTPFRRLASVIRGGSSSDLDDTIWALEDVSFEVKRGEAVGIIGRNGAGKTTLLKILSRITEPTSGGADIYGRVGSLLEVGTGFHPELTGRENIYLNGAILGMMRTEIDRKFDEMVDFAGVEQFMDTPVKHYSSGMYVRLAFAVAAHLDPEILLVDEVLSVGDASFRKKCLGKMANVANAGRTVLFVSHNLDAVTSLTRTSVLLDGGRVKHIGLTRDVVARYLEATFGDSELEYSDCQPSDQPRIRRIELRTSDSGNVQQNGEPMSIFFQIETPRPIKEARLACQVINSRGVPVALFSTVDSDTFFGYKPGIFDLVFHIPRVRLYSDKYSLTVHFAQAVHMAKIQTIEGVCPFEVAFHERLRKVRRYEGACTYTEEFHCEAKLRE